MPLRAQKTAKTHEISIAAWMTLSGRPTKQADGIRNKHATAPILAKAARTKRTAGIALLITILRSV